MIQNNLLHGFPFKVTPFESNALSHPCLLFYALLEGFFWCASWVHSYDTLDGLHTFKMGDLDDPLQLGGKEKSHMDWDQVNREVIAIWWCFLIQELPDIQGVVSRCIVVVKLPQFVLSQLSSLLVHRLKYILQDLLVDLLPYCLALLQELIVHSAPSTWLWSSFL